MRKKKLFLVTVMAAAMMAMAGCGSKEAADAKETEVVAETETEETETETEEPESEEPQSEATESGEAETKETASEETNTAGGMNRMSGLFGTEADAENAELFIEADESTGFLCSDAETVDRIIEYLGSQTVELSQDNMESAEDVLFYFSMYNQKTAGLVNTGDSNSYISQMIYNEEDYIVLFGNDEVDEEEVEVFCQEGTTIEYWAVGVVEDGYYMLVPVIAGNEENGYYIVRPAFIATGADMSDTMSLVEQGVDFTTDSDADVDDDSNNTIAQLTGDEKVSIEITGVEDMDEFININCEVTNSYPVDIYLAIDKVYLNGEDVTESVVAYIWAGANDSRENTFYLEDRKLQAGDELIIQAMLEDNETLDEIGEIEFVFNLEEK